MVHTLEMFRTLVETASTGWNFQRVIGLWAELKSLHRLLNLCDNDAQAAVCVAAWKSTGVHCQDFVFPGGRLAFDSKATTKAQRFHEISSIDQVARREATHSCMLSYVLRPVAEDEGMSIPQLIDNIGNLLDGVTNIVFEEKVRALKLDLAGAAATTFESATDRQRSTVWMKYLYSSSLRCRPVFRPFHGPSSFLRAKAWMAMNAVLTAHDRRIYGGMDDE